MRKVNSNKMFFLLLFISFVYVVSLFIGIFSISYYLDRYKINDLIYDIRYEFLVMNDYDLMLSYIENQYFNGNNFSCNDSLYFVDSLSSYLKYVGAKLSRYGDSSLKLSERDFDYLKRKYYLLQLKEYLFLKRVKQLCPQNNITIILFFFKRNDDTSMILGRVLAESSSELNNTYVLAFDGEYKDIVFLDLLKYQYHITSLPSFVIDGKVYNKLYTKEEIKKLILKG